MLRLPPRRHQERRREQAPDEARRIWSKHERWVRGFCCILFAKHECSGKVEFAHLRKGTDGGTSLRPSSWWGNPLCAGAHAEQHRIGEPEFERQYGINLKRSALRFARLSPDKEMKAAMAEAKRKHPEMFNA